MLACAVVATIAMAVYAQDKELNQVKDSKFKPGQVWSYRTRTGEESSTLTILRVEEGPQKKRIIHIRVDHIHLKNCTGGPEPETVEHMPFAREVLEASVIKVLRTGDVPDYHNGYGEWRQAWDAHKAGVYTISVAEAVDVMQETFSHGLGCTKETVLPGPLHAE